MQVERHIIQTKKLRKASCRKSYLNKDLEDNQVSAVVRHKERGERRKHSRHRDQTVQRSRGHE